jgi:hypothetical protein
VHHVHVVVVVAIKMVSRKKNQGKARKAAKAREEAEERRKNNLTTNGLVLSNIGDVPMSRDTTTCGHGLEKIDDIYQNFVTAFLKAFKEAVESEADAMMILVKAENVTWDEFADVWKDSAKMEIAMSHFLSLGARAVLEGYKDHARTFAISARYIEQRTAVVLKQTQATMNWPKIEELTIRGDDHTLVKFFRRRIPCSCLDEIYEKVKHITKMGICYNPKCSIPGKELKRSKTMYCSRCLGASYCSRECQEADWKTHKSKCEAGTALKANFAAEQQA